MPNAEPARIGRRAFLQGGSLLLAGGTGLLVAGPLPAGDTPAKGGVKAGLITDLHYADKPPSGSRYYRETLGKLAEAAGRFEKEKPDFVVELGDLIDAADSVETELAYLKRINKDFA